MQGVLGKHGKVDYPMYGPEEAFPIVLLRRILRACSCVIWWACAGRCCCIEERGVAAGVVAAEADWFLEDLNKGMAMDWNVDVRMWS